MLLNLALHPAQAAQLPISAAKITTVTVGDRCTAKVSVTNGVISGAQATKVTVSGLEADCEGLDLELTLFDEGGAAIPAATVTVLSLVPDADGSVSVSVGSYAPSAVAGAAVTIGSWGVPAFWEDTPPAVLPLLSCEGVDAVTKATKPCTASVEHYHAWTANWPNPPDTYTFQVKVETSSATDVEWQVTINLAHEDMKVVTNRAKSNGDIVLMNTAAQVCSSAVLVVGGNSSNGFKFINAGSPRIAYLMGASKASGDVNEGLLFNCG